MIHYELRDTEQIITPALIYYREGFTENLKKILELAGGAERLWPHVKTHKSVDMVRFQIENGIRRFKCASVAELEMVCEAGAEAAVLAMPPSGPTPKRLIALMRAYPKTKIFGIVDCDFHLEAYSKAAHEENIVIPLLLDVNMGMNRTGIPTSDAAEFYKKAVTVPGLSFHGLHCYDGNRHETSLGDRQSCVDRDNEDAFAVRKQLLAEGYNVEYMILGGSPTLPCHIHYRDEGVYYSLGTSFLNDNCYLHEFPDIQLAPAAAVICRVISHPIRGRFTLDLGYKAIAADPAMEKRGTIVGVSHCKPVIHSEEHYVFEMEAGHEDEAPPVGTVLYVIPHHVCPCAILYPSILIAENGEIVDEWEVTARNRKIRF